MLVVSDMYDAPNVPGYAVKGLLGVGGDANVWVAAEAGTGRRIALKVLRARDSADRERLQREAALQAGIDHPHVLRVLGLHDTGELLVLVLELAEGGSLHDLIMKRGALPPGEVVTACAPIAQALAAVHEHGLVHGDVSAANVLFTGDGRPLLADLGIARLAGELPTDVGITHGFTAPEVVRGNAPGPAADVYSLAVTVRTALVGVLPDDPRAAVITTPPLPAIAIGVIQRAFSTAPRGRPTAAELAEALFRMSPPRPLDLPPPAPLPVVPMAAADRPTHRMRRHETQEQEEEEEEEASKPYVGRRARRTPSRPDAPPRDPVATTHPPTNPTPPVAPPAPAPRREHPGTRSAQRRARTEGNRTEAEPSPPPSRPIDILGGAPQTRRRDRTRDLASAQSARRRATPPPRRWRGTAVDWLARLAPAGKRRRDLVRLATYIVVPVLLAGAVLVGWQWANSDREQANTVSAARPQGDGTAAASELCGGPAPAPTVQPPAPSDWAVVVRELNQVRSEAFSSGNSKLLCDVYVPTSETLKADLELMDLYERRGVRAQGFQFRVESVTLVSQEGGRVVLEITDELPPYSLVDEDGNERAKQPGKPKLTWRAELLPAPNGSSWRYA